MTMEMEGLLDLDIMYMVFIVSKEESGEWISLRMIMSDS